MPNIKLAFRSANARAPHIVVENLDAIRAEDAQAQGKPAQDLYTVWAIVDARKGSARPVGSQRVGFWDLDEAIRSCTELNVEGGFGA